VVGPVLTFVGLPGLMSLPWWQVLTTFASAMVSCLVVNDALKVAIILWRVAKRPRRSDSGKHHASGQRGDVAAVRAAASTQYGRTEPLPQGAHPRSESLRGLPSISRRTIDCPTTLPVHLLVEIKTAGCRHPTCTDGVGRTLGSSRFAREAIRHLSHCEQMECAPPAIMAARGARSPTRRAPALHHHAGAHLAFIRGDI
jgi:hypothetical protein